MSDQPVAYRFVAFGHSHLSALLRANLEMTAAGELPDTKISFLRLNGPDLSPNFVTKDGMRHLVEPLCRRMRFVLRRDAPQALFLAPMGNESNSIGMLTHPEPFDFAWPERGLQADPAASQIPYDLMRAQMRWLVDQNAMLFVTYLASIFDGPIHLIPPPPPIPDEEHILSYPGAFAVRMKHYGVNSAAFRLKMWMLYCDVLQEASQGMVRFVAPPAACLDQGFLARAYWSEDPTHANVGYGRQLLQPLIAAAKAEADLLQAAT